MKRFLRPFYWAWQGLYKSWRQERHLRFHSAAAVVVLLGSSWLGLSRGEWAAVLICIGMVFAAEMINAAIERLADVVQPNPDVRIKLVKDISAGAVLVTVAVSVVVGLLVLGPKIWQLWQGN